MTKFKGLTVAEYRQLKERLNNGETFWKINKSTGRSGNTLSLIKSTDNFDHYKRATAIYNKHRHNGEYSSIIEAIDTTRKWTQPVAGYGTGLAQVTAPEQPVVTSVPEPQKGREIDLILELLNDDIEHLKRDVSAAILEGATLKSSKILEEKDAEIQELKQRNEELKKTFEQLKSSNWLDNLKKSFQG